MRLALRALPSRPFGAETWFLAWSLMAGTGILGVPLYRSGQGGIRQRRRGRRQQPAPGGSAHTSSRVGDALLSCRRLKRPTGKASGPVEAAPLAGAPIRLDLTGSA